MTDRVLQTVAYEEDRPAPIGAILFMAVLLFLFITVKPYVDLTGEAVLDPSAGNSHRLNQVITLLLFAGLLIYGLAHPMRSIILKPHGLMLCILAWFLLVSLVSPHAFASIKAVVLSAITFVLAAVFLLLPTSERQFSKLLAFGALVMLGFAYYGVVFLPELSIHQASELREPMNAGFWRGHLPHKNSAAGIMVITAFIGLYVASTWSGLAGLAIVALSTFFLLHTGGKSASAMLPGVLLLAWLFERFRWTRVPIAIGGVAAFNMLAVGSAGIPPFREFVNGLGVDATFTNRDDIWRLAFGAISERPILGYGFNGFWQTPELVYSGGSIENWAVQAYNGHNAYLDIALTTGVPGLLLTLALVLIIPLRHLRGIETSGPQSDITRLFLRIWLYTLFNSVLESIFFANGNPLWFLFLGALYAFRLRSENLVASPGPQSVREVAHA